MNGAADELYSLLIPLADDSLVVPRACVKEVAAFRQPDVVEDAPAWLLGTVEWEQRRIPLLSFESLCGDAAPLLDTHTRLVVFRARNEAVEAGFFAIASQGLPRLVRLNPAILAPDSVQTRAADSPVLCRVRMVNQRPLIPDLDRVEAILAAC